MTYDQFSQFMHETEEWACAPASVRAEVRTDFATRPLDRDFEDLARKIVVAVHGPHYADRVEQASGHTFH